MNQNYSIRNQQCPNPKCVFFQKKGHRNIHINSRKKNRFQCSSCKQTWAAYKKEYYFGLRSSREKIDRAHALFAAGESIRTMARILALSPSTVQRWKLRFRSDWKGIPP